MFSNVIYVLYRKEKEERKQEQKCRVLKKKYNFVMKGPENGNRGGEKVPRCNEIKDCQ